jgi:4'-phosphopantetheinyl transferase
MVRMIPFTTPNEVHIWFFPTEISTEQYAEYRKILSREELERADRFVFDNDRVRFVASHGMLRTRLAGYCGARPETLVFRAGSHGKPVLMESAVPIQFNLSHSGSRAAIAVTSGPRCGVDIEKIRRDVSDQEIAQRFFCTLEIEWLRSLSAPQRIHGFFRLWAVKEAILKAVGKGLSMPLSDVDTSQVINGTSSFVSLPGEEGRDLTLWVGELDAADGYTSAVAVEGHSPNVRIIRDDE